MNSVLNLILVAVLGIAAAVILLCGQFDGAIEFLKEYGRELLTAAQILGLFAAGALGKPKLAIILIFTLMTTIFWK